MAALLFRPMDASAQGDTMEVPAVQDGQLALETENVNVALKWVHSDGGAELSRVFDQAQASRQLGDEARIVADQWFLENLVRIHRAGEGATYTGIQPVGTPIDARVRAADEAVATGTLEPLTVLVPQEQVSELRSEEHTSELQSLMRISYAVFCLKKKKHLNTTSVD